ncbi:hypothetical protein [Acinetobacter sp. WU_MDCI_Abxc222]|uniref:hypothetical protein n=1 Tax=Acinetobacter sp. WU_MDCI_Abxc222 TaxID=2850076 RepID=UPI0021CDCF42|nr:hypothetical protein [Acinetobacter sp. WU_MDCI_Abxc222]MCU4563285.1 hypothetical protein [Acinetobacter sp. WU_MDCI_Abxc222]
MPKYLAIAEKVYKKIKNDNLFSDDVIENLNCLVGLIRNAIKGTEFKLKYNFINFEDCLTKPLEQSSVKIDFSLIPKFENEGEFILWLAGFIERITDGGKAHLPPISQLIPQGFSMGSESIPVNPLPAKEENAEMIVNYFKSDDYIKNNKLLS